MHSITFLLCSPRVSQLFILLQIQQGFKSFCSFPSGRYNPNWWNYFSLVTGTNHWTKILQFSFQADFFFFFNIWMRISHRSLTHFTSFIWPPHLSVYSLNNLTSPCEYMESELNDQAWKKFSSQASLSRTHPKCFFSLSHNSYIFHFHAMLFLWKNLFMKADVHAEYVTFY